jgi:hypothetical protein
MIYFGKGTSEYSGALAAVLKGGVTSMPNNICCFLTVDEESKMTDAWETYQ